MDSDSLADMDLDSLTDEQLHDRRRAMQAEEERRKNVAAGKDRLGQAAHEYLLAARIDCGYGPTELGQIIIDHITNEPEQTEAE